MFLWNSICTSHSICCLTATRSKSQCTEGAIHEPKAQFMKSAISIHAIRQFIAVCNTASYHLRWCCNFWYLFVSTIIYHSIFVAVCNTASNCRAGAWLLPKETNRKRWDIKPHPTRGAIHSYKKHTTPLSSWAKQSGVEGSRGKALLRNAVI